MPISFDFTKSPDELVEYLKSKKLEITFNYEEMLHEAHQKAFTVAKITKLDLLSDIHLSLQEALAEGKPFSQWKNEIQPALEKKGWWGEVEAIDPRTGEVKDIFVGSRRLRTIYDTNMRTAYAKGRYEAQMDSDGEYFGYFATLDGATRPNHAKLHGTILPKTDKFWDTNYAPNDYFCRCKMRVYTKAELDARGLKPSSFRPPNVASKSFAYNPGDTSYALEQAYYSKINALRCKSTNAKTKEVLCPFVDTAKEDYKTNMQALLPTKKKWDGFVDRALDTSINRHEKMRLGHLSMVVGLEKFLEKTPPQSDLILADTGSIRNLKAKGEESVAKIKKTGQKNTLTTEDIKELFGVIHTPEAAYMDAHLLLIYGLSSKAKVVIGIDVGDKKSIYNTIHSGQLYKAKDLERLLEGKERIF